MIHVLFLCYDGLSDPLGGSQILPYLEALSSDKIKITILSTEKKDRLNESKKSIDIRLQQSNIIWHYIPFSSGVVGKIIDLYRLHRETVALHARHQFTFIHCRSYVSALIGLKLKKRYGVPYLFDIRGFWIDERIERGLWKSSPLRNLALKFFRDIELNLFQRSKQIITLTQKSVNIITTRWNIDKKKIHVIPCATDYSLFRVISAMEKASFRKKLNIPAGSLVISYVGSLGGVYLTDQMFSFFRQTLQDLPDSHFLLLTPNSPEPIYELSVKMDIPRKNIHIYFVKRDLLPKYIGVSDVNIFFLKKSFSIAASMPTKLGEVWACGIPVIANDIGDLDLYFNPEVNGSLIPEISNELLIEASKNIQALLNLDKDNIRQSGKRWFALEEAVIKYKACYEKMI